MLAPKSFLFAVADGVATITLNRPERLNALTFEVYAELRDTFAALAGESDVRAVVITGAGRGFCSGGDVHEIIGELFKRPRHELLEFTRMTGAVVVNMRRLPKPIIAAVNGTCAGAGAVIALAADIRIAAEGAKFAYLFTKVGLSGADMGAAFLLPRIVGLGRATEILMTSDSFDAAEAHRIGLVNRVVPADRVLEESTALAKRLARGTAHGIAVTKQMLHAEASMNLEQAVEAEAIVQALCMHHPDFREAYEAFAGKREARFQ